MLKNLLLTSIIVSLFIPVAAIAAPHGGPHGGGHGPGFGGIEHFLDRDHDRGGYDRDRGDRHYWHGRWWSYGEPPCWEWNRYERVYEWVCD